MRTQEENEALIEAKKNEVLPELNNNSAAGIFIQLKKALAFIFHAFDQIWKDERLELEEAMQRKRYGKEEWYAETAKKFQLGDTLTRDPLTGDLSYETEDPEKQIIKQCAVIDNHNGGITIKAAKILNDELTSLDQVNELPHFIAYMIDMSVAGTYMDILSQNPDLISAVGDVHYNANNTLAEAKAQFTEAMNEYRDNIDFTGKFNRNDFINYLRAKPAIEDVYLTSLTGTTAAGNNVVIGREYVLSAGYCNFTLGLVDTLNFISA